MDTRTKADIANDIRKLQPQLAKIDLEQMTKKQLLDMEAAFKATPTPAPAKPTTETSPRRRVTTVTEDMETARRQGETKKHAEEDEWGIADSAKHPIETLRRFASRRPKPSHEGQGIPEVAVAIVVIVALFFGGTALIGRILPGDDVVEQTNEWAAGLVGWEYDLSSGEKDSDDGFVSVMEDHTTPSEDGLVTVPSVVNASEQDAVRIIKGAGFLEQRRIEYSNDVPRGFVTRTDPTAGTRQAEKTVIVIYVSNGPEPKPTEELEPTAQPTERPAEPTKVPADNAGANDGGAIEGTTESPNAISEGTTLPTGSAAILRIIKGTTAIVCYSDALPQAVTTSSTVSAWSTPSRKAWGWMVQDAAGEAQRIRDGSLASIGVTTVDGPRTCK